MRIFPSFQIVSIFEYLHYDDRDKGARFVATLGDNSEFAQLDIEDDVKSLAAAMTGVFSHFDFP